MRQITILIAAFFLLVFIISGGSVQAQTTSPTDNHTASEEAEGKVIWEKLQTKQFECKDLTDDNYAVLGEYFMGQSIGDTQRHVAMNQMMISMMGEEGEEQMHIAMGKRNSGCGVGFMPMMWMMRGGGNPMMGYGDWGNMMGWGFGILGWLFMIIFWILIILGVVALIRYLGGSGKSSDKEKTPLEILKERYARGEIGKKEFEEMKKDLK
ncbi:MAG: hypothetical protein UU73_C0002G0069 [Candidatus Daviesbacteria bacterium GW2011_GWA1_41_61]|uniref:SHOCT domain-containing protein n=1 Tax=Candidatus Daviesbacteria bacterium GW2011_GWA2_40_9 TaxID=1618424 RepID=A0A0G0WEX0_9BACT|nr:MAG: coiled-coil [Candidatus Daviesbacteria bacterium GW2011_GWC1_40_9]KKR82810.1 MAG: hypothetical protein UU29_C0009G0081 [Candidatus Daviesbacteria bacterium GW2011_GWA2_40_9]KKR93729.1 MAG: hypothetical protein UU44_C0001G0069 [Candidatus Daviesbacteria bacterium GW2011_GWB1_41_15]KKS15195.1 MAG: hypothetical protein UU73_C0002G0069 [Candidatus Daviesbacteria bacterium GW2011_GWA1_41_61]